MGSAHSHEPLPDSLTVKVGTANKGEGAARRHWQHGDSLKHLPFPNEPDVNTLWAVFRRTVSKHGETPCLGRRPIVDGVAQDFKWETYEKVFHDVLKVAKKLKSYDLPKGSPIGIFSINRPEWVKSMLAIWSMGNKVVPLYATLGSSAIEYVINHSEASVLLIEKSKFDVIVEDIGKCEKLKTVIQFEDATEEQLATAKEHNFELLSFNDLLQIPDIDAEVIDPPKPDDLAYIMYTSGTTGDPKGVLLSHKNVLASVSGMRQFGLAVTEHDVYLSYLPLAHSFETVMQVFGMCAGARVGFYQGNPKKLTDDIMALRPTLFAGVPRVYSRIYDKVMQKIKEEGGFTQSIFEAGYKSQLENVKNGTRSGFWDMLVFNKMKKKLGGRVRLMCTGAAPMPDHVYDFLRVGFQCEVLQGYGMTENAASAMATPAGYTAVGTVGCPLPCTEVKLIDIPEMKYFASDENELPCGEVHLRGANIFQGYFKNPEKTAETKDKDGWLATGDVGRWNKDGSLSIIDRKKNIFKLAQGEFVAAEEVESVLGKNQFVGQIWIYGNSFKTCVLAVVVPDVDPLKDWCKENEVACDDIAAVCEDEKVKKMILESLTKTAKDAKLSSFKIPKAVIMEGEIDADGNGFNVENETLTPTFKLKRPQLLKRYQEQIDAEYEKLG